MFCVGGNAIRRDVSIINVTTLIKIRGGTLVGDLEMVKYNLKARVLLLEVCHNAYTQTILIERKL